MKRGFKITLIVAAALVLAGVLISGITAAMLGESLFNARIFTRGNAATTVNRFPASEYDTVAVSTGSVLVTLGTAAGDDIEIETYESSGYDPYVVSTINGTLSYTRRAKPFRDFGEAWIRINVPAGYTGSIEIDSSSGRVVVADGFTSSELTVTVSSGAVVIGDGASVGTLSVKASSGAIRTGSLTADTVVFKTTSGSVRMETLTAARAEVSASSGSIRFTLIDADAVYLDCSSGSISGTMAGEQSDYAITSSTGSGSNSLPTRTDGERWLEVDTGSGRISIKFEK